MVKSETSELPFTNNQEGLPASLKLSTTTLPCRKLRDIVGRLTPEGVVKSVDNTDLAYSRVNIVKS